MKLPYCEAISRIEDPLKNSPERTELFLAAVREMAVYHQSRCPELAHLYRRRGFDPASIRSETDLANLPSLQVTAMKSFLLLSLPEREAVLRLTSSGTRGQKTQIWFDQASLDRVQMMLETLWRQEGLVSAEPNSYLMFVYDPEDAKDLGIAFSDKNQQRFAPVKESVYAIRKNARGDWEFDHASILAAAERFSSEGVPVRLFGMPAFLFEFLELLEAKRIRLRFHPDSLVMTGGGWKAAEDKQISRADFRARLVAATGIPDHRIRDGFGMAEHCAPYMECREHRLHVPIYNRILIRDPETMAVLPPGRKGLMELLTPFNAMMPTLSILSTDYAVIDSDPCPCGANVPTFTLHGRAGLSKHKGCALQASEIVSRKKAS